MSWKSRADISIQNIIILVLVLEAVEKLKSCPWVDVSRFYGTTDFQQRIYKILKDFFDFESLKNLVLKVENVLKIRRVLKNDG